MATDNTPRQHIKNKAEPSDGSGSSANKSTAAEAYQTNAQLIYSVGSFFLPSQQLRKLMLEFAENLLVTIENSHYRKYINLTCLKVAYNTLAKQESLTHLPNLDFVGSFCLLLRDRFDFSCYEIASIIGTSEGSVRTKLERSREKAFPIESETSISTLFSPISINSLESHFCIKEREKLEDFPLNPSRLGEFEIPSTVKKSVGNCQQCSRILQHRLNSIHFFRQQPFHEIAEDLVTFPVAPVFTKKGKRLVFNWTVAPWYAKAIVEGLLATTLVLGVVLSIPRLKTIYEFWQERRLDLYSIAELAAGLGNNSEVNQTNVSHDATSNAPEASHTETFPVAAASPDPSSGKIQVKPETEFVGKGSEAASSDKLYRVLMKTDSPESMKEMVAKLLRETEFQSADEETQNGAEIPGGVLFDVFVPLKNYKSLIAELSKIGEAKVIITRAKEKGITGKAHVKIWLQRI